METKYESEKEDSDKNQKAYCKKANQGDLV
jgi:hypothetical protein